MHPQEFHHLLTGYFSCKLANMQDTSASTQSKVTSRGQTTIPAIIRKQLNLHPGNTLMWINDGQSLRVVPVPADALAALYGRGKGENLSARLLQKRGRERGRG